MAAVSASVSIASPVIPSPSSSFESGLGGTCPSVLPPLPATKAHRSLRVRAGGGKKIQKIQVKEPFGPTGGAKFKEGLDASGRKATGKGVYQFSKKYGANVDGYSPIYNTDEWSSSGDIYAGGTGGLTLWALTLGAILLGGALLVYNTSALAQ